MSHLLWLWLAAWPSSGAHALDLQERARWNEPATLAAFGAAVAAALIDAE